MEKKSIVLNVKDFNYFKNKKKTVFFYNYILDKKHRKIEDVYKLKISKKNLISNIRKIDYYYSKILNNLSKNLTVIHKVKKNQRFWSIILGPWIVTYIQNMMNMWLEIDGLNRRKNKFYYNYYEVKKIDVPNDFNDYLELRDSLEWRSSIYSSIIKKFFNKSKFIMKNKYLFSLKNVFNKKKNIFYLSKLNLKFLIFNFFNFFRFTEKKVIFLNTSIGHKKEIIYSIKNTTIPFFFFNLKLKSKTNKELINKRNKLIFGLVPQNDFEKFIFQNISNYFPKSYLEDFDYYNFKIENDFPKKTKLIISQTIHFSLDLIKFWVANMIEKGSRLVSLQHGANSGYGLFLTNEYLDKKNSDIYSTWGWDSRDKKIQKGIFYLRKPNVNKKDRLLLVMHSNPTFQNILRSNLIVTNNIEIHNFHINLIYELSKNFNNELVIRLPKFKEQNSFYKKEIFKINKNIKLDENAEFLDSLKKARMVITSYDATPFLQSLNLNTPTIGFWDSKTGIIGPKMFKYFKELKKNNILMSNEKKINNILMENYKNIESWWKKPNRLKAVRKFRNNFCRDGNFSEIFRNNFL